MRVHPVITSASACRERGQTLAIGRAATQGMRAYLAVAGGFSVPSYLGSRSTFILGQFGGHGGRAIRTGDVLALADNRQRRACRHDVV